MKFRLRTMMIVVGLLAVASLLTVNWLRRPVEGRLLTGQSFQLSGHDALFHCVLNNDAESLGRLLLMDSYDLDRVIPGNPWTLLQHAVHRRSLRTTTLLLENGANPNAAAKGTPTPSELAQRSGDPELIDVLDRYASMNP
jgi:hypothetical protein